MLTTLLCYLAGNILHMWLKADATKAGTGRSYRDYFSRNKAVLVVRFAATSAVYVLFTQGGAAIFGESAMPSLSSLNPACKGAVCLLFGLSADSVLDKVVARLPWIGNEIPPAPKD